MVSLKLKDMHRRTDGQTQMSTDGKTSEELNWRNW